MQKIFKRTTSLVLALTMVLAVTAHAESRL